MTALLHTRDMEKTVRALGAEYGRVLVRTRTDLENPIRLRRGKIADLEPRIVLNDPSFDSQLQDWELNGGILLYERPFVKQVRAHHAQLFVECPLSVEELEYKMQATHDVAVVYRPPRWDEHRRDVAERFPTADLCQKFFKICAQCTTDVPLQGALEVSFQHLNRIRYTLFNKYSVATRFPVILRHPPDDRHLGDLYRWIERECPPAGNGVRTINPDEIKREHNGWRAGLRRLARAGAIVKNPAVYTYRMTGLNPDWEAIQRAHVEAGEKLETIIAKVDASPEFVAPASPAV